MFSLWSSKTSVFGCLFLLSLLLSPTEVYAKPPFGRYRPIKRSCSTDKPSKKLKNAHQWLSNNEIMDNDLWNSSLVEQRWVDLGIISDPSNPESTTTTTPNHDIHSIRKRQLSNPVYTIDVYIHIVADTASANPSSPSYITDTMITNQFTTLQTSYAPTGIGFQLINISRTTNTTWASNNDDRGMKTALRRGTYSSLNIYYQSQLQYTTSSPGIPAGTTLLGFCSLPSVGFSSTTPRSAYVLDGCNILSATMPGGTFGGYNLGMTTVHEVGHWNGLLHTFQGLTCSNTDFGDYVADTPQEKSETSGCPTTVKDTCPDSGVAAGWVGATGQGPNPYGPQGYSGPDPIHNYMDYSNDACYTGFTPGQAARAINVWNLYRQGL